MDICLAWHRFLLRCFAPETFYTRALLHHKPLTPEGLTPKPFYTRNPLHQKTCTPEVFYTRRVLHQRHYTSQPFYATKLLHKRASYTRANLHKPFTREIFYAKDILRQRAFYTTNLLRHKPFAPQTFYATSLLHPGRFTPETFYTTNPFTPQTPLHHKPLYTSNISERNPGSQANLQKRQFQRKTNFKHEPGLQNTNETTHIQRNLRSQANLLKRQFQWRDDLRPCREHSENEPSMNPSIRNPSVRGACFHRSRSMFCGKNKGFRARLPPKMRLEDGLLYSTVLYVHVLYATRLCAELLYAELLSLWCCDCVMFWFFDVVIVWWCDYVMLWCCDSVMLWLCDVVWPQQIVPNSMKFPHFGARWFFTARKGPWKGLSFYRSTFWHNNSAQATRPASVLPTGSRNTAI